MDNETVSDLSFTDDKHFEELRLDNPSRLDNETVSDLSFTDDNHFEELRLDSPSRLDNEITSDLSFTDDNHFEELRLDNPSRLDNETASDLSFAYDNFFEELKLDAPSRLGNETAELMIEANNSHPNKGLLANIIEMELSKTDAKRTHDKHSALFYGKVTSINPEYKYLYSVSSNRREGASVHKPSTPLI